MHHRKTNVRFHTKRSALSQLRPILPGMVGGLVLLVGGIYATWDDIRQSSVFAAGSCNIKGNVSIKSRERIFHMPGQEDYDATKISPQYGERWFCSEAEARAAGWRKARN